MMDIKQQERKSISPMRKLTNGIAVRERMPISMHAAETPLVFLHGSGFDSTVFEKQFGSQILAHHHVIAIDLPGHGNSDNASNPNIDYSYAEMGEKVLEALSLLDISEAILVGWSLGGQIALEINQDSRVKGVFACGVAPIAPGPMGMIRAFQFSRDLLLASKAQHNETEAQRFENACLNENADGRFVDTIMRTDSAMRPAMSKNILMGSGLNQRTIVESPSKPICLVQGAMDPFIRTDYLKGLDAMGLFAKEVIVLENSGHAPFLDQTETFDLILSDFAEWVDINAFAFDRALMNVAEAA